MIGGLYGDFESCLVCYYGSNRRVNVVKYLEGYIIGGVVPVSERLSSNSGSMDSLFMAQEACLEEIRSRQPSVHTNNRRFNRKRGV
jgi:hypothetical protein